MVSERQKGERSELEKPLQQIEAEEALHQAGQMSDTLNRINTTLHSTLDFGEILQKLVVEGSALLGSESAAISLRQDGGWTVSFVHGMPSSLVGTSLEDDKEVHAVLALRSRQPVAVADAFNDERFNREHLRRHNIRSVLVAPLITRNQSLGVVFFNYHTSPHEFTDVEVNFAWYLASTAALVLENARLFDERKQVEEEIRQLNDTLEQQVAGRTKELAAQSNKLKAVMLEREQLIEELQNKTEYLQTIMDNIPVMISSYNRSGEFIIVNRDFERALGWSTEELNKVDAMTEFHPDPQQRKEAWKYMMKAVREWKYFKVRTKGGDYLDSLWSNVRLTDSSHIAIGIDITERKTLEQALRASEEQYRSLVQNLPGVTYIGRKDWSVEFMDHKVERFTGYTAEEFCSGGKRWSDLIVEEDLGKAKEATIRALKTDRIFVRDYRIKTKDGNIRWVEDRGNLVCDEKGEILHINGVFFDITERRALDAKLSDYQRQLRFLTSELAFTEARERRYLAQDLHDSIGQTLALSKLRVDAMRYGEVASKISSELKSLSKNLEEAIDQTQSLIFKLSPPVLYQVGLDAALEYLAEMVRKETGISISVDSEIDCTILSEKLAVLLFRAVQELLTNTVKHAKASNASITLRKSDDHVYIEVQDDGIGFNTHILEEDQTVLERFGLFSIRERLYHLGADIQLESAPGRGTKIVMTVPLLT